MKDLITKHYSEWLDIVKYKISSSNLEDYLEYNYPNCKITIL